jgi:hypothetical protein
MASNEEIKQQIIIESDQMSTVAAGGALAVIAWSGLIWVVLNTLPTVPNRWLFYALLHIALTGTAMPLVRFLHQRFSPEGGLETTPGMLIRQSTWVGLLGTASAWLLIPRLLSIPLVVVFAFALILIEGIIFLRSRLTDEADFYGEY